MLRDKPLHNFLFETDATGFYDNLDTWCTPWIDTCCLLHLIRKRRPATFLEIGTHKGYTTRIVAQRFPELAITTVDPGDQVPVGQRPGNQGGEFLPQHEIGQVVTDFPNVRIIKQAFGDIDWHGARFDFVFIDGNHSHAHVIADSRRALELLTPHGTIVWHDYNNAPDVNRALGEIALPDDQPIVGIHNTWIAYLVT